MKYDSNFVFTITVMCLLSFPASAQEITIVHFEFQPFETAILNRLIKDTGINGIMEVYPWARAYNMALEQENILIGPLLRTEERESLLKFFDVPTDTVHMNLYRLKNRKDITVNTLEDAKQYMIGGVIDYSSTKYLLDRGFEKQMDLVSREDLNIKKLFGKRVDMIIQSHQALEDKIKKLGLDINDVEKVYTVYSQDMGFAFSRKTSDDIVNRFNSAFNKMNDDGTLDKLRQQYQR